MKFDQKFIGGALIIAAWGALVVLKMVPADQFVNSLQGILIGLGVYHVASNKQP